jgi:hypothetical protein
MPTHTGHLPPSAQGSCESLTAGPEILRLARASLLSAPERPWASDMCPHAAGARIHSPLGVDSIVVIG